MKAGTPSTSYWATPAPGVKTEFEANSAREWFMSFSLVDRTYYISIIPRAPHKF
jgi:hypothetical protein